jgi:hypothetical protein
MENIGGVYAAAMERFFNLHLQRLVKEERGLWADLLCNVAASDGQGVSLANNHPELELRASAKGQSLKVAVCAGIVLERVVGTSRHYSLRSPPAQ